jgi:peptide subunit release factor 1 (eRF1)
MVCCFVQEKSSRVFSEYNDACMIIYPPKPLQTKFYTCGKTFDLNHIIDMYGGSVVYGICLLSGEGYFLYSVEMTGRNHKEIKCLSQSQIHLQKKQKKGGSSAGRIERLRQVNRGHYIREIAEIIKDTFANIENFKGIIVAGPTSFKLEVIKEDIFQSNFSKKLLRVIDTNNGDTIHSICNLCQDILDIDDYESVCKIDKEIQYLIQIASNKLVFGIDNILDEIKNNTIEKVVISRDIQVNFNSDIHVVVVPNEMLRNYDGMIGIKYYSSSFLDDSDNNQEFNDYI